MRAMLVAVAATLVLSAGCGGDPPSPAEALADHPAQYRQDGLAVGSQYVRDQADAGDQVLRRGCSDRATRLQNVTPAERLAYMQGCRKAVRAD